MIGLTNAKIQLRNPKVPECVAVEIEALADTGVAPMCIPEHIQIQLQLEEEDAKEVTLADGSRKLVPYVDPIELLYENRTGIVGALAVGDEPQLGIIPMEDTDLVVVPGSRSVTVNPSNPKISSSVAKRTWTGSRYTKHLRRRVPYASETHVAERHIPST